MRHIFESTLVNLGAQEKGSAERVAKLVEDRTGVAARLFAGVPDQLTGLANQYITVDLPALDVVPLVPRTVAVHGDLRVRGCIYRSASTIRADVARRMYGASGKGIVWAVIDSGVDGSHPHFRRFRNLSLEPPLTHMSFVSGEETPEPDSSDTFGHGTFLAGIIAGENEGVRVAEKSWKDDGAVGYAVLDVPFISGIAPECKILSLRVLDDEGQGRASTVIQALAAIQRVNASGLRVHGVNIGVHYDFDSERFACGRSPICVEAERLVRSGVVVVVAAGNTGYGVQKALAYSINQGMEVSINDPGNAELVITVGSTHREMPQRYGVSYFSSKGPTLDGRLKPDLVAPGEQIVSCATGTRATDLLKSPGLDASVVYGPDSGTSVAAAHVSGAAAALLSARSELVGQPDALKAVLMNSAVDLARSAFYQGRGVVDVLQAVEHHISSPPVTAEQLPIAEATGRRVIEEPQTVVPVTGPTDETSGAARALRIMYSYSHRDEPFKDELDAALAALRREGLIEVWHDRKILPGSEFDKDIVHALQDSDIIMLLVSKYFIDSDYCWGVEMKEAIRRHQNGSTTVIPIILKRADWKTSPFGKLTALPKDGKPIVEWQNADVAWGDVAEGIRRLVTAKRMR